MKYEFILEPFVVIITGKKKIKKRKVYLNMNVLFGKSGIYIGLIKDIYTMNLSGQLARFKCDTPIKMRYTLIKHSKRRKDRNNALSIVDKFFCDALMHYNCIPDDNDDIILETVFDSVYIKGKEDMIKVTIEVCKEEE